MSALEMRERYYKKFGKFPNDKELLIFVTAYNNGYEEAMEMVKNGKEKG